MTQKQNQLIFTFYVLIHLFFQDDGLISKYEQKHIKRLIKRSKGILDKKHYQKIAEFTKNKVSVDDVTAYIHTHKLPRTFVLDTMKDIKKALKKQVLYKPLIKQLEKEF